MIALMSGVFLASVAGSLHCAGMCGGFVAIYSCGDNEKGGRTLLGHGAYSFGRLAAYLAVGAVFGAVGAAVNRAGAFAGVRGVATYIAGGIMIVWGVVALLRALDVKMPVVRLPAALMQRLMRVFALVRNRPPAVRALLLGLTSALLPCGWLYAFAVLAAGTGGVVPGLAVMLAFWAGTLPVMLLSGFALQAASMPLKRRLPAVSAAMLILIGALWLAGFATMPGEDHAGHDPSSSTHADHNARP